ncbi:AraC family transcriptional regulator [Aporhodopirellula aestuarii]|uniref:AraC family transcriptional regulator n=1 Tax=Aporhodopirellula aestuarii TaxID=2950107 RepID=A0ABT0U0D6_9BACT|nr:AraC family transcriptional regulator [Aporhodopirellula aestuarii]MCM2370352.1 AraC family transcriptional regulator [Aporhodopirellula aestuarii]
MTKSLSTTTAIPVRSSPVPPNMRENGLWVFESRHAETFAMSVTQHSFLKLLWIREGRAAIEVGTETHDCEMGDLVVVPPRTRHRIVDSPNSPVSLCGLGVNEKQLKCVGPVMPLFRLGVYAGPRISTLRIEHQFRKLLYLVDQDDVASQLSSVAVAMELLADLALRLTPSVRGKANGISNRGLPKEEPSDPMLEAYLDWLQRNFYEPLTLDGAAKASGMSRRTFTSRFKQRTGMTWLEYVNMLRVRRAEELLQEADRKVTSIAFQCGFDDLSTFYRAFKRITGRTPSR